MKTNLLPLLFALLLVGSMTAQVGTDPVFDRGVPPSGGQLNSAPEPFYLPNKLVQPPIYGWDIKKTLYAVESSTGGGIRCESGTVISIPPNAFVDESGNPVEGKVQIDYREFRDPIDFVFSGIPMTYDSGGASHTFQSAGMFDIAASQEGRQVFLAPGKPVKMDFVSTDSSTSYNFYVLDEKKGTWVNKGKTAKPVVLAKTPQPLTRSDAAQQFLNWRSGLRPLMKKDSTHLESRFQDTSYYFTLHADANGKYVHTTGEYFSRNDKYGARKRMLQLRRVRSGKKGEIAFQIKNPGHEFPELNAFNNKVWVLSAQETSNSFRKKYTYKKEYSDIRLEASGTCYDITLKERGGFVTLRAFPIESRKVMDKEHEAKNTTRMMTAYHRAFSRRERRFDKSVDKDLKDRRDSRSLTFGEQEYWTMLKQQMTPAERVMSFQDWKSYCNDYAKNEQRNVLTSAAEGISIIRSLELDGMGVFNCDQIARMSNPVVANASYKKEGGKEVETTVTYVIDNRMNGILRYDGYKHMSPSRIAYSSASRNILVTIQNDGKVAYSDQAGFKKDTDLSRNRPEFEVKVVDPSKMSVAEFKTIVGLNR
jgi:hypothetical protein